MLMNLTRMRSFNMKERLRVLKKQFKGRIPYGDQDLLNILFSQHRETLHRITCRWNYLFEHCNMIAVCSDGPVAVLHGWRDAFTTQPESGFVAVHQAMKAVGTLKGMTLK
ncbi:hypothetical protein HPB49_007406 [Dermacentor silvarum]|uniref:Uncharacterized protein n=1 Tax=Dermacentor silvarum TaxID=543639 RepID=A0ACB8CDP0_DERSI|nr:hypothetical protein HPB49_007406 [Dermacentor silvarum]